MVYTVQGDGEGGNLYTEVECRENISPNTTVFALWTMDHLLRQAGGGHVVEAEVVQPVDEELTTTSKLARMQEDQDNAVISSMAALLVQEEAGLGLAQTQAADSGPEHRAASPADGQEEEMLQASPTRYFIVEPSAGSLTALEAAMSHTNHHGEEVDRVLFPAGRRSSPSSVWPAVGPSRRAGSSLARQEWREEEWGQDRVDGQPGVVLH